MAKTSTTATPLGNYSLDEIMSLSRFLERYPDLFTENQIRWLYFHRKINGLEQSGAVIKRNGRLFVVIPRIRTYLVDQEEAA
jgi:hypothetical protein